MTSSSKQTLPTRRNVIVCSKCVCQIYRTCLFVGPSVPALPLSVATPSVLHNRVTVEWSVPVVTYDPETYVVMYGSNQSDLLLQSEVTMATRVELLGLVSKVQYYYQVWANNSAGNSSSDIGSFTTA